MLILHCVLEGRGSDSAEEARKAAKQEQKRAAKCLRQQRAHAERERREAAAREFAAGKDSKQQEQVVEKDDGVEVDGIHYDIQKHVLLRHILFYLLLLLNYHLFFLLHFDDYTNLHNLN